MKYNIIKKNQKYHIHEYKKKNGNLLFYPKIKLSFWPREKYNAILFDSTKIINMYLFLPKAVSTVVKINGFIISVT